MLSKIEHFVIIRLNVKSTWRELTAEYARERLTLFRLSTLISLESQRDRNFSIILVTDKSIPDELKLSQESIPDCETFYIDNTGRSHNEINPEPLKNLLFSRARLNRKPFILTTNLDSDDLLGTNYISEIHNFLSNVKTTPLQHVFTPHAVFLYDAHNQNLFYKNTSSVRPLFSMVERDRRARTCIGFSHVNVLQSTRGRLVYTKEPLVQIIHPRNIKTNNTDAGIFANLDRKSILNNCGLNDKQINELDEYLKLKLSHEQLLSEERIRQNRHLGATGGKL